MDELYWFIERKERSKTRENIYLMTLISREPRQIINFCVADDKSSKCIQEMVDSSPDAEKYCTDGYLGYLDVIFPGEHVRNVRDKSDTFTIEGINADIRHYIPVLARKSRCFCRKIETLDAVLSLFVYMYNKFGEAKLKHRVPTNHKNNNNLKHLHMYQDFPFSFLDFLYSNST